MKKPNRLIHEKSPYLRQHAYNPVDWYPWGKEAFERAKKENKPIFLSIGYATCHWCHVMERESFEDEEVAKLLNETFVCIKVDREERPDIDTIYMQYCIAANGHGGWPLTIFMTPDRKPFFAATYIPKYSRGRMLGMVDLIPKIRELWRTEPEKIEREAEYVAKALQKLSHSAPGGELTEQTLREAYNNLAKSFDTNYGGFGRAPKFPTPHNLLFLLRYHCRYPDSQALSMVKKTLWHMRQGGIFDQLGYGFHRYSTDEKWLLPHFEKMLYDQALLALAYVEAFQLTREPWLAEVAEEIFSYVLTQLRSKDGAFFSAQDADSEGEEGKYYVWTEKELRQILGDSLADFLLPLWGVQREGNYLEEGTGRKTGKNILYFAKPLEEWAKERGLSIKEAREKLEAGRQKLLAVRKKRTPPLTDDKILTDWNGLMIVALAKGGAVLQKQGYLDAAEKAFRFVMDKLYHEGMLYHRYREGERAIPAFLDDYAFLSWAALELYWASWKVEYLERALQLSEEAIKYFWDDKQKGFFFTSTKGEKLIARPKEVYDGAIPSGNSVMALNLLRLAHLASQPRYSRYGEELIRAFSKRVQAYPTGYTYFLMALDFQLGPTSEVLVRGRKKDREAEALLQIYHRHFLPRTVFLFLSDDERKSLEKLLPFTESYWKHNGPVAFVCQNGSCQLPTRNGEKVLHQLSAQQSEEKEKR